MDDSTAVVQFVLGPGKECQRTVTSFFQDVDYLADAGRSLTERHGLCNVGQWHSHHIIPLFQPSAGDNKTVWSHMPETGLVRYIVFIANIKVPEITVNCFLFEIKNGQNLPVEKGYFKLLRGESPMRLDEGVMKRIRSGAESLNENDFKAPKHTSQTLVSDESERTQTNKENNNSDKNNNIDNDDKNSSDKNNNIDNDDKNSSDKNKDKTDNDDNKSRDRNKENKHSNNEPDNTKNKGKSTEKVIKNNTTTTNTNTTTNNSSNDNSKYRRNKKNGSPSTTDCNIDENSPKSNKIATTAANNENRTSKTNTTVFNQHALNNTFQENKNNNKNESEIQASAIVHFRTKPKSIKIVLSQHQQPQQQSPQPKLSSANESKIQASAIVHFKTEYKSIKINQSQHQKPQQQSPQPKLPTAQPKQPLSPQQSPQEPLSQSPPSLQKQRGQPTRSQKNRGSKYDNCQPEPPNETYNNNKNSANNKRQELKKIRQPDGGYCFDTSGNHPGGLPDGTSNSNNNTIPELMRDPYSNCVTSSKTPQKKSLSPTPQNTATEQGSETIVQNNEIVVSQPTSEIEESNKGTPVNNRSRCLCC